jgi:hypothetical protein
MPRPSSTRRPNHHPVVAALVITDERAHPQRPPPPWTPNRALIVALGRPPLRRFLLENESMDTGELWLKLR